MEGESSGVNYDPNNVDGNQDQNNSVVVVQTVPTFNPASYNLPQFRFKHLPSSEVRSAWNGWIRGFERVMRASGIADGSMKKIQLLAMGGLDLQNVFDGIPGADEESEQSPDPYAAAKTKLDNYFSPKHHECFERYLFWSMSPDDGEAIEKFLERIQQKAEKCVFGKTELESRQIAVIDKVIQLAPSDLREKLLEKENLTLDKCIKIVNSHQAVKYQAAKMSGKSNTSSQDVQRMYVSSHRRNFSRPESFRSSAPRCTKCGHTQHQPNEKCPAINQVCMRCQGIGHFKSVCRSQRQVSGEIPSGPLRMKRPYPSVSGSRSGSVFKKPRNVMRIETEMNTSEDNDSEEEELPVYNIAETDDELIHCNVGGVNIEMLIDSGSKYNLIDDTTWKTMMLRNVKVNNIRLDGNKKFLAYGKVPLRLITVFDAEIEILGTNRKLSTDTTFYVIEKGQQPLLGKVTAQLLGVLRVGLGSNSINHVELSKIPFPSIKDIELTLPIDRSVPPVIQPLRRCPIPLLDKVKTKLDDLVKQDIVERVEKPTSWVSPLVPILKDNGDLRLCIDMRRANQAIQRLNHPLPVFEEILPRIRNARYFSLLDMKESYYHVTLSEGCRDVTTFITNWGLYRFKRLFFGVNCAPELFQSLMESLLASCPNLVGFIDDFLVFGDTEEAHDAALKVVVRRFEELGIQLNHQKCKIKQQELVFLGHRLSGKGVLPSDDKVQSILNFRSPKTKEELRSFLGLVTFVSRFIPDLATVNHPLRDLIKQSSTFVWEKEHQTAFEKLKQRIGSIDHLGYFDPKDRTLVIADASGVGLGAVLIQFKNNQPRVISYASKSLSETEKKYPPIEKEALAIVWSVERFKVFLLGITFEIETDHRPLETLFTRTSRPTIRIERWLLRLQAFRFNVVYRKGSANLADSLSRLASHVDDPSWNNESEVYIRSVVSKALSSLGDEDSDEFDSNTEIEIRAIQEAAAIDISEVVNGTKTDDELTAVRKAVMTNHWENSAVRLYAPFQNELSYINGLVMRGLKLVIPQALRDRMCQLAHEGHPGQSAMKSRLRDKCWWPNMDKQIIKVCESCEGCRLVHSADPPEPMSRRSMPDKPWVHLAIDFLGPMPSGEYILVVIDYYSRFVELEIMTKITAFETIQRLKRIFRTWGYPRSITLDNAKQFVSKEFGEFCEAKGIVLNHSTPYWPQANGEVERQNRSLLKRLKISNALYGNWKTELDDYLILYNNTPHSVTGMAPSELLQNRKLRFKIPQMEDLSSSPPTTEFRDRDTQKKFEGKRQEDSRRGAKPSGLQVGDTVLMKNLLPQDKLSTNFHNEKFLVVDKEGTNVTVQSKSSDKCYERNTSHLRKIPVSAESRQEQLSTEQTIPDAGTPPAADHLREVSEPANHDNDSRSEQTPIDGNGTVPSIRRSLRVSKPARRYSP